MEGLDDRLGRVEAGLREVRSDIAMVRTDIATLRTELVGVIDDRFPPVGLQRSGRLQAAAKVAGKG